MLDPIPAFVFPIHSRVASVTTFMWIILKVDVDFDVFEPGHHSPLNRCDLRIT